MAFSRWDSLEQGIKSKEKLFANLIIQWNSYRDLQGQISKWIKQMEKAIQQDKETPWYNAQELRSIKYFNSAVDVGKYIAATIELTVNRRRFVNAILSEKQEKNGNL